MIFNIHDRIVSHPSSNEFERLYIELRNHEKRIYTDKELTWLPEVSNNHIHKAEWDIRKKSCKKLVCYLSQKKRSLKMLEVGCGNGWLSYQLSQIKKSNVVGLDINLPELQQAERVFAAIPNLRFVYGSLDSPDLNIEKFDIIIFAASIQYFNSFHEIIESALEKLNDNGEIHIIDSHFYSEAEIEGAKQRSRSYFHSYGFDRMEEFYFHRSLKELDDFNSVILYNPHRLVNKILKRVNPFHWICIKK